jgi:hypothetical protein
LKRKRFGPADADAFRLRRRRHEFYDRRKSSLVEAGDTPRLDNFREAAMFQNHASIHALTCLPASRAAAWSMVKGARGAPPG